MVKVKEELQLGASASIPRCGIVMPISEIDGCTKHHWGEVLQIISSAVVDAGFEPNLVSDADEVGFITKRIVQNIYENPIVVCDVSAKNPNVMFELGMRLAFDKPTIIVKDDKTAYSFDIGGIEHIPYPRDLRFASIVDFKLKLTEKIKATVLASSDPQYTTFLKHFGEFVVAKLDRKEVSTQEYVLEELKGMRRSIASLQHMQAVRRNASLEDSSVAITLNLGNITQESARKAKELISHHPDVYEAMLLNGTDAKKIRILARRENAERLAEMFSDKFAVQGTKISNSDLTRLILESDQSTISNI
jgi:hypothetical protein